MNNGKQQTSEADYRVQAEGEEKFGKTTEDTIRGYRL
jgi:hypothetical protein